jgi:hypothetical protein
MNPYIKVMKTKLSLIKINLGAAFALLCINYCFPALLFCRFKPGRVLSEYMAMKDHFMEGGMIFLHKF